MKLNSKSVLLSILFASALLTLIVVYLGGRHARPGTVAPSIGAASSSSNATGDELGLATAPSTDRIQNAQTVASKESTPAPDPNEVKWRKVLADLDNTKQYSIQELAQMSLDIRKEISRLTLDKLNAMVRAGNAEVVNLDSTKEYHVQQSDLTEITSITHMPGVGILRAVLPRNGNELAYDLQDRVLALEQELKQRARGE